MIGHYVNHKGGRVGCGGGGGSGRARGRYITRIIHKKKTVDDYLFYAGSSKQASDYEITAKFVVNDTNKTFDRGNDVSEEYQIFVKSDTEIWKPILKISPDKYVSIK